MEKNKSLQTLLYQPSLKEIKRKKKKRENANNIAYIALYID